MVFGLWSACASVGNIIGALEVASVLDYGYEVSQLVVKPTASDFNPIQTGGEAESAPPPPPYYIFCCYYLVVNGRETKVGDVFLKFYCEHFGLHFICINN